MKLPKIFTPENTPVYVPMGLLTMAGIVHNAVFSRYDRNKRRAFTKEVEKARKIMFEGDKAIADTELSHGNNGLETIAYRMKPSGAVFLEESVNYPELGKRYGISPDELLFYTLVDSVGIALDSERTLFVNQYLDSRAQNPAYSCFNPQRVREFFDSASSRHLIIPMVENAIGGIFQEYFTMVRDFEAIGPMIKEEMNNPGRKLLVIGAMHLDYLLRYLRGQAARPLSWHDYRQRLDPKSKNIVESIERLVASS